MKGGEEIGEDVMVTNFSVSSSESVKKKKKKRRSEGYFSFPINIAYHCYYATSAPML